MDKSYQWVTSEWPIWVMHDSTYLNLLIPTMQCKHVNIVYAYFVCTNMYGFFRNWGHFPISVHTILSEAGH